MSMLKGFSNAFRVPELRRKILVTLGLLFVCRLIAQIPTPGVDWNALNLLMANIAEAQKDAEGGGADLFGWLQLFTGGAMAQCSIGFLSIWPYISAQIVIQLLSSIVPVLQKMRKEGENGRQQLAQITRYLTIVLCVVQSFALAQSLCSPEMLFGQMAKGVALVHNPGFGFFLMTVICMTTASLFVMWLADQITTFGIGNGASLIIMINITSRLPQAAWQAYQNYFVVPETKNPIGLIILLIIFLIVVMGTVMLTQGVRKVAIHSTRRSLVGGATYGMQQTFMPLRVNYTGVMPIIFAQPLIQIVGWLLKWISGDAGAVGRIASAVADPTSALHASIYAALIVFFTFFWVATQFNAIDISENFKRDGSYIPGIRPGLATAEYLDDVMTKITLIGAMGLLIVALFPTVIIMKGLGVTSWAIASFFGGTSLLIIVGVALDTLRIMESHLLVRKYEGFLSHGSLRGRGGM